LHSEDLLGGVVDTVRECDGVGGARGDIERVGVEVGVEGELVLIAAEEELDGGDRVSREAGRLRARSVLCEIGHK
jgi:hypothetical protein